MTSCHTEKRRKFYDPVPPKGPDPVPPKAPDPVPLKGPDPAKGPHLLPPSGHDPGPKIPVCCPTVGPAPESACGPTPTLALDQLKVMCKASTLPPLNHNFVVSVESDAKHVVRFWKSVKMEEDLGHGKGMDQLNGASILSMK